MCPVANRQRSAGSRRIHRVADRLVTPREDIAEIDGVAQRKPGDRAGEGSRVIELQCPSRAAIEADGGVRSCGEFDAARTADLSLAGAVKRALDHEPTYSARRQRAGIGYFVRASNGFHFQQHGRHSAGEPPLQIP